MSKPFAIAVYVVAGLFFAAFFAWPLAQILHGGLVDADGRFTLAGGRQRDPGLPSGQPPLG